MLADSTQVHALAVDLALAPVKVAAALVPVAHRAGNKMKSGLRSGATGHRRLPGLARGISYELSVTPTEVSVSAGWFAPSGQGHLENIAVVPSGGARNAPVMDINAPLQAEVRPFMRWAAKAAAEAAL